jgi:hypothetical protein
MPLQRHGTGPVPRPPGLVPPTAVLTGVTELRLHGVGGTVPQDLLADDAPQQVSGDRIAGFYRTADRAGRHVEAYSWGGLTSRSASRVLWLLLLPFTLANLAGWMCPAAVHRSRWAFRVHRAAVRWAALAGTVNLLVLVAVVGVDLLGYQCGGQDGCAGRWWPLRPLRHAALAGYPGRRMLVGVVLPLAVVVLLTVLTLRSISRYESVRPPGEHRMPGHRRVRRPSARSAAQPGRGLAHPDFWDGRRSALHLGCLHVATGVAVLALLLTGAVRGAARAAGAPVDGRWWATLAVLTGVVTVVGAAVAATLDGTPGAVPLGLLVTGAASVGCAVVLAGVQPAYRQVPAGLPGTRQAVDATLLAVTGSLLVVLLVSLLGGRRPGTFRFAGPFVVLAVGAAVLNVVLLAATSRVADLLGPVSTRTRPAGGPGELSVHPAAAVVVPYLTVAAVLLVLAFCGYELVAYWRAGTDRAELARIRGWYRDNVPPPDGEPAWRRDALADPVRPGRTAPGDRWAARVARARRLARAARHTDVLLTSVAVLGLVVLVLAQVYRQVPYPPASRWMFTVGSWLATAVPVVVVLVMRRGWHDLASRRRLGVLWDVGTFWPRAYHPLAPPSYAERAVPELQRRMWRLHDSGGRVLLAAHSQGSVLAVAALAQPANRPADGLVVLVTFGSPLRTLYGWAFPAYFGPEVLRTLVPDAGRSAVLCWRNVAYRTDYIGGPVLAADPPPGPVDVELPDPPTRWYVHGEPEPAPARHSGYWADAALWREVDRLAVALATHPPVRTGGG